MDTASRERGLEDVALELRDLTKRYASRKALDGLSFSVGRGRMFGFVGANGAGKTTAMRIVLGVLEADSGEVFWNGAPVDAKARRRFGYMPEERGLYPKMRVRDQLVYFALLHGKPRKEAASATDLWLERLGVSERANDRVEALSLGNQQRVQLAAALVHEPELLVLDEPFSGLDPVGVDALSEVLKERVSAGVPVVFSSHQLELVERLCDEVAIVREGKLVASGSVDGLSSGGARVLRVRFRDEPDPSWLRDVEGARIESVGQSGALVLLEADADEQRVLDAARKAGRVTHFGFERRALSEVFREVMSE